MRNLIACVLALILAACEFNAPSGFRDTDARIGATTRFDPLAFSGTWIVVASFMPRGAGPVVITLAPEVAHLRITSNDVPEMAGLYRESSVGQLVPVNGVGEPLIVMWVDEDFTTAAVGTVSGSFGVVLHRDGDISDDLARAAREIFAFYGWEIRRLKGTIR